MDLILEFSKMNGAGNDFVVIDNRFFAFSPVELSRLALLLCPRRTSVGADGVLAMETNTAEPGTDFRMRYYNADGSLGTMCGNGARCLVRFAVEAGVVEGDSCRFSTDAGIHDAAVVDNGQIRLFVPQPSAFREVDIVVPDSDGVRASYIWTGTEHAVCFVPDINNYDVARYGPELRQNSEFGTSGANVNFVTVLDEAGEIRVRTYEKGVEAETLACGTGAIAAALVSYLNRSVVGKKITVRMPGGALTVGFEGDEKKPSKVYLEGPADTVYRGSLPIDI